MKSKRSHAMDFGRLTWVVQSNAIGQSDLNVIAASIKGLGCRLELLRVVPFLHQAVGRIPDVSDPCIVYGSSGLLALARRQGWAPAGWDGAAFEAATVNQELGPLSLNNDAIDTTFSKVADVARTAGWEKVFVRPNAESKEFPGRTFSTGELQAWVAQTQSAGYFDTKDSPALVAPYRPLGREWRVFLVDGLVVCYSQYADQGEPFQADGGPS